MIPAVRDRSAGIDVGKKITDVAMESTGSYLDTGVHLLEESIPVTLANALHVKGLKGHKTDVEEQHLVGAPASARACQSEFRAGSADSRIPGVDAEAETTKPARSRSRTWPKDGCG